MKIERMRDPAGNAVRYSAIFENLADREQSLRDKFPSQTLDKQLLYKYRNFEFSEELIVHQYGAGVALGVIRDEVVSRTALMLDSAAFMKAHGDPEDGYEPYPLDGIMRGSTGFSGIALLLVEQEDYAARFQQLLSPTPARRSYLMDLLMKAFIPDFTLAKKYKADKEAALWMDPVLRALAGPAEARAGALAAHMKNWCRIMRPWGWKPELDTAPGKDTLFCDFAFEVALAVCAYDIDDSSFNDHPYYPRDLVEHYRAHVRHTRDAWRPEGVGAGVPVVAPPPPKKADLAKSKRKAAARWVELACDGNVDATEAVLEAIGKPRKFDEIDVLMEALGEASQAIHADIKDDETLAIQAGRLAEDRGLGEFEGPSGPPFGPARCSATLLAFAEWMGERGYRLVDLDNQDDAWHAVVVKAEYHDEFIALSEQLRIVAREPADVYND